MREHFSSDLELYFVLLDLIEICGIHTQEQNVKWFFAKRNRTGFTQLRRICFSSCPGLQMGKRPCTGFSFHLEFQTHSGSSSFPQSPYLFFKQYQNIDLLDQVLFYNTWTWTLFRINSQVINCRTLAFEAALPLWAAGLNYTHFVFTYSSFLDLLANQNTNVHCSWRFANGIVFSKFQHWSLCEERWVKTKV